MEADSRAGRTGAGAAVGGNQPQHPPVALQMGRPVPGHSALTGEGDLSRTNRESQYLEQQVRT